MKKIIVGLTGAVVLSFMTSASATLVDIGAPFEVGSWGQRFQASGVGNYAMTGVWVISGTTFEAPDFSNFSASGWSSATNQALFAKAVGPRATDMQFDISFKTALPTPFVFDFRACNGAQLLGCMRATWSGGGWSFAERPVVHPIPDGGLTAMLLGMSVLGLGWVRRIVK